MLPPEPSAGFAASSTSLFASAPPAAALSSGELAAGDSGAVAASVSVGAFTASPVVLLSAVEEGVASAGSEVAVSVAVAEGDELAEELGLGDLDFVGEDFELEELLLGDNVTEEDASFEEPQALRARILATATDTTA